MSKVYTKKRVLITRQLEQIGSFVNRLSAKNHYSYLLPMIETSQLCTPIDEGVYEVILFTSVNAVRYFVPYNDRVQGLIYIAVGIKTAQAMEAYLGIYADRVPVVYNMENVKDILMTIKLDGAKILSPGAKVRSELSMSEFKNYGAKVISPAIYETSYAQYPEGYIANFLEDNKINVITFCSPSAAKSFYGQIDFSTENYDIVSIGSTTSDYLESIDIKSRYPLQYTVEGMCDII